MGLSSDPEVRARQVANLYRGAESPGAAEPGNQRALKHGAHSQILAETPFDRLVAAIPDLAAIYASILDALPTRQPDGSVPAPDALAAQSVARQGLMAEAAWGFFARKATPQALAMASQLEDRYARALDRIGVGPAARARLLGDVARGVAGIERPLAERMAAAAEEEGGAHG